MSYSDEVIAFYHSSEWRGVRAIALQRDKFLCQICLKKGQIKKANTVHHIEPIRKTIHGKNVTAGGWSKRLELENLESICAACHNREHPEKGYTQKTKRKIEKLSTVNTNKNTNVFKFN